MVFAGITADGKTPLIFVESGIKTNSQNYLEDIPKKKFFPGNFYTFEMATGLIRRTMRPFTKIKWHRSGS